MVFDIHRDSSKRNATTLNINGKDYARFVFVISISNKQYEENLKFAKLLHNKIDEKYPGLSRGVMEISKTDIEDHNTLNQDLLNDSLLMEVGGVENTLEETYRSVDILAEIIADII